MGQTHLSQDNISHNFRSSQKVFVIFGGETSERQVSLMSGTNVWLNLRSFDDVIFSLNKCSCQSFDGIFLCSCSLHSIFLFKISVLENISFIF